MKQDFQFEVMGLDTICICGAKPNANEKLLKVTANLFGLEFCKILKS